MKQRQVFSRLLACGVLALAAMTATQAQEAGVERLLVRPNGVVIRPRWSPQRLALLRQVPTYGVRLGLPTVRYSYGEFSLMRRGTLYPGGPRTDTVVGTPSDQYHANTNPVDFDWNDDFDHCRHLMTSIKDKGQRGSCHAMAAAALVEALVLHRDMWSMLMKGHAERPFANPDLSEQWLMYKTKQRFHAAKNEKCGDGGDPKHHRYRALLGRFHRAFAGRQRQEAAAAAGAREYLVLGHSRRGAPHHRGAPVVGIRRADLARRRPARLFHGAAVHPGLPALDRRFAAGVPQRAAVVAA